ncbi:MAG: sulfur carrier protein ThiS [Proteobacteria bacterium]|nr:sulfur carrier protein ThiS [Pseudomonadota bacterium]
MGGLELQINGERKKVSSLNVEQLISELSLENKKIAVELNKEIISRNNYSSTVLKSGDILEIISFVGGG